MARFERTTDVIEKYLTETCIIMNIMIKLLYRNFNKEYLTMITGELKNKIDSLWDAFAAGGLVNPFGTLLRQAVL